MDGVLDLAAAVGGGERSGTGEGASGGDVPLPVLREDLDIVPGAPLLNGSPSWVVFDPLANRYFEIGPELFDMLSLWDVGTVSRLCRAMKREFDRTVSEDDVTDAIRFLISSALVRDIPDNDYRTMAHKEVSAKKSLFSRVMHSYLFFKIPLVRPDRALRFAWPVVRHLFTREAVVVTALIGLLGLYLVSRQWEHFATTFQHMLSWQGAALYFLSLVVVKSLHELGHAFMAVRYRLRVPTIGVAFMVLMPVLYTDTSGAWRLRSRRARLMIDAAGIFTELGLACIATLVWCFLPDGGLRLVVFAIATTSWATSLFVNLNPLMRFDGYYILSDAIRFQNMQTRGFDMARWQLRRLLFGLDEAPPEPMSAGRRRLVVAHAWATWIYRFFLFLGIAILVYAFFIKVVGILLFAVEIVWFILLPVGREIARWWERKDAIMASRRTYVSLAATFALLLVAVIPWSTSVSLPALMASGQEARLFAPFPAQIVASRIVEGQRVRKGDVLVEMAAPRLHQEMRLAAERARVTAARIDRAGSDQTDRAMLVVLENELNSAREEMAGLRRTLARLTVRAPFDGVVRDLDPELQVGLWVDAKRPLALVHDQTKATVRGLVEERLIRRFAVGASATFKPENPDLPSVDLLVDGVAQTATERLDEPYLALAHGGSVKTGEGEDRLKLVDARYRVKLSPLTETPAPARATRGTVVVEGSPESFYFRAKRQVMKVLVREMGV